jgi:hypothetical protein
MPLPNLMAPAGRVTGTPVPAISVVLLTSCCSPPGTSMKVGLPGASSPGMARLRPNSTVRMTSERGVAQRKVLERPPLCRAMFGAETVQPDGSFRKLLPGLPLLIH